MCGFVGFTGTDEQSELVLTAMMNRIIQRGPDMGGQHIVDNVALGFRRLSILDLSEAGAQPMSSDDGKVTIVFNGEIYNFQELRAELEAAGYAFHCNADTEVLVHGYEEWGEDLVNRLRGMYAFVIHDQNKNKLFGARDIFGIKPFYYYQASDGSLLFGSEIKSFLDHPKFEKAVNHDALRPYLTLQFPATEETFFKGVFKLAPAHCFTYDLTTNTMDIKRYWSCDFTDDNSKTFEEYVDECDKVVHESVAAHRIADVKVGSFLSGGVDSSYIAACLMPDTTYSVGFDYKNFNETNYAAELSDKLGIKNVRKMITADEFFDALPDIQYHMDEPQSNLSSVPLYYLAQMASEEVTVVLSGEGADEVFGGYLYFHKAPDAKAFHEETVRKLGKLYLYDCLRANKSLAAWGIEGRVPFLDKEFLDVAMGMNPVLKMCPDKTIEKKVVREAFADLLPEEVAWRQKEQFSDGVGYSWIDTLKQITASAVSDEQMAHAAERFPINPPQNKEEYYYRSIFAEHFPSDSAAKSVPSVPSVACSTAEALAWDASFKNQNDPSGRAVAGVHEQAYK